MAIATGTATFIGRLFFGAQPAFSVPSDLAPLPAEPSSAFILLLYVGLGAVVGVAAALFVRSLHWAEDGFDKIPGRYLRHMLGMLLVGVLIYALMRWGGHYYVEGRRLRDDPGDPHRPACRWRFPAAALRVQAMSPRR